MKVSTFGKGIIYILILCITRLCAQDIHFSQFNQSPLTLNPAAVNTCSALLTAAGLKVSGAVLSGNVKDVILEEARQWDADLIVVGSHGRRGFKRLLLGSVSDAIAMNAHCSVVVVRGAAAASKKARKAASAG